MNIPYCVIPSTAVNCDPVAAASDNPPPPNVCTLKANQVFPSSFTLVGNTVTLPGAVMASHNAVFAMLFVVVLLSGLTLRRHSAYRLTLPLLLAALALTTFATGCGSAPQGLTPGTYKYVIGATQTPVPVYLSATATVTVQ